MLTNHISFSWSIIDWEIFSSSIIIFIHRDEIHDMNFR